MKNKLLLSLLFLFPNLLFARDISLTGRFIPPDGKTLVFGGQNNADSDHFVKINGRVPYGFMIYTSLRKLEGLTENVDLGAGETGGKHILENYPGAALQIGLYLVGDLQAIIDGQLDENIKKFADWIKNTNVPVFLRIGYEFDFPENGYNPALYVKAYRKIVNKFDKLGIKNAAYVWHSYAGLSPNLEAYYPGDEYVDWFAISYFESPGWLPMLRLSQRRKKPLMIAESAPMQQTAQLTPERKPDWFRSLFRFIETHNIKALSYINTDWNAQPMFAHYNWGNSRLDSSPEIEELWLKQIKNDRFVFRQ